MVDPVLVTGGLIALIVVSVVAFFFWFNREPEPSIPPGAGILSPASGRVSAVTSYSSGRSPPALSKGAWGRVRPLLSDVPGSGWLVAVVMNIHDVHVQRCPADGEVLTVQHFPGKFKPAILGTKELLALENERLEILMNSPKDGRIKVIQVAGLLARRTRCDLKQGQKFRRGERLGKILLGSMVILILPTRGRNGRKIKPLVNVGDRVIAGETLITRD